MKDALSEARNKIASATSLGSPNLPIGWAALMASKYYGPTWFLGEPFHPLSVDRSRCHRIDPYAMLGPFDSQMLCQAGGQELRRAVCRLPRLAGHT